MKRRRFLTGLLATPLGLLAGKAIIAEAGEWRPPREVPTVIRGLAYRTDLLEYWKTGKIGGICPACGSVLNFRGEPFLSREDGIKGCLHYPPGSMLVYCPKCNHWRTFYARPALDGNGRSLFAVDVTGGG